MNLQFIEICSQKLKVLEIAYLAMTNLNSQFFR